MIRRPKLRRVMKWVGVSVCVAIIGVYCLSWCAVIEAKNGMNICWIQKGAACIQPDDDLWDAVWLSVHWRLRDSTSYPAQWWPKNAPVMWTSRLMDRYWVPLWIPFVCVFLPTAILFWMDRPPPKGCCLPCGYNLTGNVSGVCPECGAETYCAEARIEPES